MNAIDSPPPCGLCRRPRRWVAKREAFALYCNGQNCNAEERPCKNCGVNFRVGEDGSKPRECAGCVSSNSTTTSAGVVVRVSPKWAGREVQQARAVVSGSLPAPCGKCGDMVDGDEPWTVGHILSRATHPEMTHEPTNWQAEHRACSDKSGAFAVREIAYRDGFADGWATAIRLQATAAAS